MSYDLSVWYPSERISNTEATQVYIKLCDSDTTGVSPNPAVDAFYEELTGIHPEIDDMPEDKIDECPWNCAFDRSPGHVIMCCGWDKSEYCLDLIWSIAQKHGLALFDPQSETIVYPDGSSGNEPPSHKKPWWKFW